MKSEGVPGRYRARVMIPGRSVSCIADFTQERIVLIKSGELRRSIAYRVAGAVLYGFWFLWMLISGSPPLPDSIILPSDPKDQTELEKRGEYGISRKSIEEIIVTQEHDFRTARIVIHLRTGGALQITLQESSSKGDAMPRLTSILELFCGVPPLDPASDRLIFRA